MTKNVNKFIIEFKSYYNNDDNKKNWKLFI